ncbi:MAG TPA: serine/threonine protein kinase, partial [Myxococcales bacterium]|nr:serine/threonine protein kinase [Myxococcales bacterium]
QIVLRCLAKDPADRPESADALLASLAQAQRRAWDHERAHAWWVEHAPPRPAP